MSRWLTVSLECMAGLAGLAGTSLVYALGGAWFGSPAAGIVLATGWVLMVGSNTVLAVGLTSAQEGSETSGTQASRLVWLYAMVHVIVLSVLVLASLVLRLWWVTAILGIPLVMYALILARVTEERRSDQAGISAMHPIHRVGGTELPLTIVVILWAGVIPLLALLWILQVVTFRAVLVSAGVAAAATFQMAVWWVMAYYRRRPC